MTSPINYCMRDTGEENSAESAESLKNVTCPRGSSCSSLMQNEMISVPMDNLNGGLKATCGSATGGHVRYFSQFGKDDISFATTSTTILQQQQWKPMGNGDFHANGRGVVPRNGMRFKTEQQQMRLDRFTQPTAAQAQSPATVTEAEQDSQPLALLSSQRREDPKLDVVINNVVCVFSVGCQLNLDDIGRRGWNVECHKKKNMLTMKLRRPSTLAFIWSSGTISCTGATSEIMAKVAARKYARCLQKLGFPTRFQNFRIVNVLGTCRMPWPIQIVNFSEKHRENARLEPELRSRVTYKMRMPKVSLKIYSTGSTTVLATSENDVKSAIEDIYPLVHEFRNQRPSKKPLHLSDKKNAGITDTTAAVSLTTASTITDPIVAQALQEKILAQSQMQLPSDIMVNVTAAHAKTIPASAAPELENAAVCNMERVKQIEAYIALSMQTREERRHIPFPMDKSVASLFPSAIPKVSPTDNIHGNARRRAIASWDIKIQKKQMSYISPSLLAAGKTTTTSASSSNATTIQPLATYPPPPRALSSLPRGRPT